MKILLVDDAVSYRDPLEYMLSDSGFETATADNGKLALELLAEGLPDLILLDVSMPEMDGLTFAKCLKDNPDWAEIPVIFLTALNSKDVVLAARSLGINDFLVKSYFSFDQLLGYVRKFIAKQRSGGDEEERQEVETEQETSAGADAKQTTSRKRKPKELSKEVVLHRVRKQAETKSLPGLVVEIMNMTSSMDGHATSLADMISKDGILAGKVLQVANSAAYAGYLGYRTNLTLTDAVVKVGFSSVRDIATAVGVYKLLGKDVVQAGSPLLCWQHCFAVALMMGRLTTSEMSELRDIGYQVGLFHDVAQIVLQQEFPEEYAKALHEAPNADKPFSDILQDQFKVSFVEVVKVVLEAFKLPQLVVDPIIEYLRDEARGCTGMLSPSAELLRVANYFANAALCVVSLDAYVAPIVQRDFKKILTQVPEKHIDAKATRAEVQNAIIKLADLGEAEQAALKQVFFEKEEVKIWYARHPNLSFLDPLGEALKMLATTHINFSLPQDAFELEPYDAIIVSAPQIGQSPFNKNEVELSREKQDGMKVPVLYLAGDISKVKEEGDVQFAPYPITLADLREFISNF